MLDGNARSGRSVLQRQFFFFGHVILNIHVQESSCMKNVPQRRAREDLSHLEQRTRLAIIQRTQNSHVVLQEH